MRYLYCGVGILLVTLAFCLVSVTTLDRYGQDVMDQLEVATELGKDGQYNQALTVVEKAQAEWKSHVTLFGILLRHDEADQVVSAFDALAEYARMEIEEEFTSNCAELIAQIDHIMEMEWPYLYNIL